MMDRFCEELTTRDVNLKRPSGFLKQVLLLLFFLILKIQLISAQTFTEAYLDSVFNQILANPLANAETIDKMKKISLTHSNSILFKNYRAIGVYYGTINLLDSAHVYFNKAISYTVGNSVQQGIAIKNLAIVCRKRAKFAEAINLLTKAAIIFQRNKDQTNLASVYMEWAANYNELENSAFAIKYLLKGMSILKQMKTPNKKLLGIAKMSLADFYMQRNDFRYAKTLMEESLQDLKSSHDFNIQYMAKVAYGICLVNLGEYKAANIELNEAFKGSLLVKDSAAILTSLSYLGDLSVKTNKPTLANEFYLRAINIGKLTNSSNCIPVAADYFEYLNSVKNYKLVVHLSHELKQFIPICER